MKLIDDIKEFFKSPDQQDREDRQKEWDKKWDEIEANPRHNPLHPTKRGIASSESHIVTQTIGDKTFSDTMRIETSVELIKGIQILSRNAFSKDMLNRRDIYNLRIKDLRNGDRYMDRGVIYEAKSDPYLHNGYWHINCVEIPQYEIVRK